MILGADRRQDEWQVVAAMPFVASSCQQAALAYVVPSLRETVIPVVGYDAV